MIKIYNKSSNPMHAHWPLGPVVAETENFDFARGEGKEVPDPLAAYLLKNFSRHFITDEEANRRAALARQEINQKDDQIATLKERLDEIEGLTAELMAGQVSQSRGLELTARLSQLLGDKAKPKPAPAASEAPASETESAPAIPDAAPDAPAASEVASKKKK